MTIKTEHVRSPKVTCIVVNWNGWRDTIECLNALKECTYPDLSLIVVDNGSTGIRRGLAEADYVWLLNNDTKPAPDALSALVAKANTDEQIGAVASICYYAHSPSNVQVWGGARVNLWLGYCRNATEPQKDEWFDALYGASMLIRRAPLHDVGLLDQSFFG